MKARHLHNWRIPAAEAVSIQKELAGRVIREGEIEGVSVKDFTGIEDIKIIAREEFDNEL